MANWIPGISQAKSFCQAVCGDTDGAKQTQIDFLKQCPGVSQVTSLFQWTAGDSEGALDTQKQCLQTVSRVADGVPLVGHVKGVGHYAFGDTEGGHRAMLSASRTTGAMAGGALGFVVAGPLGAFAGGVAGAGAFDSGVTAVDSLCHGEYRPSGYYAAITNVIKNPNPGDIFDACLMPVGDGLAGYAGGRLVSKLQNAPAGPQAPGGPAGNGAAPNLNAASIMEAQANAILDAAEAGKLDMPSGEYLKMANQARDLWSQAQQMKGGQPAAPVDLKAPVNVKPASGGGVAPAAAGAAAQQQQDQLPLPQVTEVWAVWLDDTTAIIGSEKLFVDVVAAYILKDKTSLEEGCKPLGWKYDFLFSEWYQWSSEQIAKSLDEMGALQGITKETVLKICKETGRKAKKAVKMFLSNVAKAAEQGKEKDKKAKRGEHVINNGVLKVYTDIMNIFLARQGITSESHTALSRLPEDSLIRRDMRNPFRGYDDTVKQDIPTMVVYPDQMYIDANAVMFGLSVFMLKELCVHHMKELHSSTTLTGTQGSRWTQPLKAVASGMNARLMYVDRHALGIWLRQGGRAQVRYERAQQAVEIMLEQLHDRAREWVLELRRNGYT